MGNTSPPIVTHRSTAIARTSTTWPRLAAPTPDQHTQSRQPWPAISFADYRAHGLRSIRRTRDERDQSRDAGLEL